MNEGQRLCQDHYKVILHSSDMEWFCKEKVQDDSYLHSHISVWLFALSLYIAACTFNGDFLCVVLLCKFSNSIELNCGPLSILMSSGFHVEQKLLSMK